MPASTAGLSALSDRSAISAAGAYLSDALYHLLRLLYRAAGGDPEEIYIQQILPEKCRLNLEYLKNISVCRDIAVMFQTAAAVLK